MYESEPLDEEAEICVRIPASALAGLNKARIEELVADHIAEQIDKERGEALKKAVAAKTEESVDSVTVELVRAAVAEAIREGWIPPTPYYAREAVRVTLRERVDAVLSTKPDRYDSQPLIDKLVKEQVRHAVNEMVAPEAKRAADAFRKEVDDVLRAKLGEALRSALGLSAR